MVSEVNQDGQEKISSVLTFGLRAGLDSRRIQLFGIKTEQLNKLLPKFVVSSQQILERNIAIKDFPTRIVIRRGAIDGFLDAVDRSCFDVAMFYEGEDMAFLNFNEDRTNLRGASKKNLHKSINQQSTDVLKESRIKEEQLFGSHKLNGNSTSSSVASHDKTQDLEDEHLNLATEVQDEDSELTSATCTYKRRDGFTDSKSRDSYIAEATASFQYGCTSYLCTTNPSEVNSTEMDLSADSELSSNSSTSASASAGSVLDSSINRDSNSSSSSSSGYSSSSSSTSSSSKESLDTKTGCEGEGEFDCDASSSVSEESTTKPTKKRTRTRRTSSRSKAKTTRSRKAKSKVTNYEADELGETLEE